MNFAIKSWAAWAPGIVDQDDWSRWATEQLCLPGDTSPDVSFLPAVLRRRLSLLSKAVHYTTHQCVGDVGCSYPSIVSSCFGECGRTYALLKSVAEDQLLSPMEFSLSVHNAVSGQVSIATRNEQPSIALAPGTSGCLAGAWEAIGLLQDYSHILLTYVDEPLPVDYARYTSSPGFITCLSMLITQNEGRQVRLLDKGPTVATSNRSEQTLDLIEMLLSDSGQLCCFHREREWQWQLAS